MNQNLFHRCLLPVLLAGFGLLFSSGAAFAEPIEFAVSKTRFFIQTNSGPPGLDFDRPFVFVAQAHSEDFFFFLSTVTVTPPGRPAVILNPSADLGLTSDAGFATKAAMDNAFPAGVYVAQISDLFGGSTRLEIELSGEHYPAVPLVANYADAQAIGAASDFELRWPVLTGTILSDSIALLVVEGVLGQQQQVFRDVITATLQTSGMVIPANTLRTDGTNFAALDFQRLANRREYPSGDKAGALFGSVTQFPVRAPKVPHLRVVAGGPFRLRFNSIPNRRYEIATS